MILMTPWRSLKPLSARLKQHSVKFKLVLDKNIYKTFLFESKSQHYVSREKTELFPTEIRNQKTAQTFYHSLTSSGENIKCS